jgi:hypothetical protein
MGTYEVTTDGENIVGPVTLDQIRRGLVAGKIPAEAQAREVGSSEWLPLAIILATAPPGEHTESTAHVPAATPKMKASTASRSSSTVPMVVGGVLAMGVLAGGAYLFSGVTAPGPTTSATSSSPAPLDPEAAAKEGFKLYDSKTDEPGAAKLWEPACAAGNQLACTGMGIAYTFGRAGKTKDHAKGRTLVAPACAAGIMRACSVLGQIHFFGWGIDKDIEQGRTLWKKACDGDEPRGCFFLGLAFSADDGPPSWRDVPEGERLIRKACSLKYEDACKHVKKFDADSRIKSLRLKVKRKYWDDEPDGECTGKGLPPYRYSYEGGTYAEDEEVAGADGCRKLHGTVELQDYCCPTKPLRF